MSWLSSLAATVTTPVTFPGAPPALNRSPALPLAATTVTPAAIAFLVAAASGSSGGEKSEPSDMFTTSRWWFGLPSGAAAQSSASLMTSDDVPVSPQPKIFSAYNVEDGAMPGPTENWLSNVGMSVAVLV